MDMPSRRADAEFTYAAATEWVNRALRYHDSLFTPGKAIWTAELLSELRARFLDHPDDTKDPFYTKVRRQLTGSEPEVFQLMAEAFYFVSLIVWHGQFKAATKLARVKGLLLEDVEIPDHLVKGLDPGMAGIGPGFASGLPYYVGYIIEFADQWKESEPTGLLDDPWGFKEFALGIDLKEGLFGSNTTHYITQRHALLHLVFPDEFQAIVSTNHKNTIANAFSNYVSEPSDDVDRRLMQIRSNLESELGRGMHFYDPVIQVRWNKSYVPPPPPPRTPLQELAESTNLPADFLENLSILLEEKKQVIFQGPPGTGKTHIAQELAAFLSGGQHRVKLVQFHPSYAYEDFVQGFRPNSQDGNSGFVLRDGPLLQAARAAESDPDSKHFLVIDEINRGNLAKVFGELYFLLEYRDRKIQLQYSDKDFSLPGNLYIIGTMNTADRSIALVDLAFRRRFYFVDFHPDKPPVKDLLRKYLSKHSLGMEWVADVVDRANSLLQDDRHAAIGPSYFLKQDLDEASVERIWEYNVFPYIEERLFGYESDRLEGFRLINLRESLDSGGDQDSAEG